LFHFINLRSVHTQVTVLHAAATVRRLPQYEHCWLKGGPWGLLSSWQRSAV